ncbi:MAG: hypothetical protein NZ483_01880 [Verrucomicrobiae bacterium]|nr:hypothetical protein [Verrucomicrobiae bacterium]MDW8344785.1 hypothetical protein [Verrucomicrobiae bacterium]
MIVREEKAWYQFEKQFIARSDEFWNYSEAAQIYEELWLRGYECGAIDSMSLLEGIEADIEMARTLNALAS